jgi:hypothetical protein
MLCFGWFALLFGVVDAGGGTCAESSRMLSPEGKARARAAALGFQAAMRALDLGAEGDSAATAAAGVQSTLLRAASPVVVARERELRAKVVRSDADGLLTALSWRETRRTTAYAMNTFSDAPAGLVHQGWLGTEIKQLLGGMEQPTASGGDGAADGAAGAAAEAAEAPLNSEEQRWALVQRWLGAFDSTSFLSPAGFDYPYAGAAGAEAVPPHIANADLVHAVHQIAHFERSTSGLGLRLSDASLVVALGAGYGALPYALYRNLGFRGVLVVVDTPVVASLARLYLGEALGVHVAPLGTFPAGASRAFGRGLQRGAVYFAHSAAELAAALPALRRWRTAEQSGGGCARLQTALVSNGLLGMLHPAERDELLRGLLGLSSESAEALLEPPLIDAFSLALPSLWYGASKGAEPEMRNGPYLDALRGRLAARGFAVRERVLAHFWSAEDTSKVHYVAGWQQAGRGSGAAAAADGDDAASAGVRWRDADELHAAGCPALPSGARRADSLVATEEARPAGEAAGVAEIDPGAAGSAGAGVCRAPGDAGCTAGPDADGGGGSGGTHGGGSSGSSGDGGGASIHELLAGAELAQFEPQMAQLGVLSWADLQFVQDSDLQAMGMTTIQQRKFAAWRQRVTQKII